MQEEATQKMKADNRVMGYHLPEARLTLTAYLYFFLYAGLPFLGVMALLDLLIYTIMRFGFGLCYGFFCLL